MSHDSAMPATPALSESISVRFDEQGLIPVIAQDAATREILLLAYMNVEALDATLTTGELTLWSRSRRALWRKGETSGHRLRVLTLRVNCEANSLLAFVELAGPGACHEGYRGCYYRALSGARLDTLTARIVEPRVFDPIKVYAAIDDDGALERDARVLYAAYECLRDAPLVAGSRTAVLLHMPDTQATCKHALARAQQELDELRGVIAGTHQHYSDERDVALEASQVGYWVMVAAVALCLPYDAWNPHRAWLAGWYGVRSVTHETTLDWRPELSAPLTEAGALCRFADIHPNRAIAADLAAMRLKCAEA